jgi:hypothetical protein
MLPDFGILGIAVSIVVILLGGYSIRTKLAEKKAAKKAEELEEALDEKIRAEARVQAQHNAIDAMEKAQREPLPKPDLAGRTDFEDSKW